jgi:predicted ATPase
MRLKLQNIGIIEEADITVDGITLIAGQNDSGKSTIGKVLYALIRGVNGDEISHNWNKMQFVARRVRDIDNLLSRTKSSNEKDEKIQSEFTTNFSNKLRSRLRPSSVVLNSLGDVEIYENINKDLKDIYTLYLSFSNDSTVKQLETFINDFESRISISFDSQEALHYRLESFLKDGFGNQIKNKFKEGNSFISIEGVEQKKISFDEHLSFKGFDSALNFYYNEVLLIESPFALENSYFVRFNNDSQDKNEHLNNKIFHQKKEQDIFSDTSKTIEKFNEIISEIIRGEFAFNSEDELIFKKQGIEFDLNNVATGIKSFGIIQMLLENDSLNSNSLLILDEPEVHLHPIWQVKYAEILVLLSKEFAIPMVLTSHSPYFIEALEAYTKKYKYESSTNFYYAEKNEDGLSSKIVDVNDNLSKIYSSISEASFQLRKVFKDE